MRRKHLILAVLVTAIWGLNFPITKLGLATIDPLLLTAIRFSFTAFPLVFFCKTAPSGNALAGCIRIDFWRGYVGID